MEPGLNWLVGALEVALREPLPGPEAQFRLAPSARRHINEISVVGKACRESAVLILLYPREGDLWFVLTVRGAGLPNHAGQVSLPGGRREAGESFVETALREAYEELGVDAEAIQIVGALTPIYVPPSNFCVYPQVAFTPNRPIFTPHEAEVSALIEVPLRLLTTPGVQSHEVREIEGDIVEIPFFGVGGHRVWGATAMMLSELLAVMAPLWEASSQRNQPNSIAENQKGSPGE